MKKQNILIAVLILVIVILVSYICYDKFYLDKRFLNDKNIVENNNSIDNNDNNSIYNVDDYVSISSVELNDENKKIKKVSFNNIDNNLVEEFLLKQDDFIEQAKNNEGESKSDIWYQMNGNILTVYYDMHFEDAMGECNDIAVINIDLENNKLVTNEELLKLGNSSFNDIAEEHYNKTLKSFENCDDTIRICGIQDKDYNIIKVSQFEKDKSIYIDMIVNGLDGAINCYIKDGKITI